MSWLARGVFVSWLARGRQESGAEEPFDIGAIDISHVMPLPIISIFITLIIVMTQCPQGTRIICRFTVHWGIRLHLLSGAWGRNLNSQTSGKIPNLLHLGCFVSAETCFALPPSLILPSAPPPSSRSYATWIFSSRYDGECATARQLARWGRQG